MFGVKEMRCRSKAWPSRPGRQSQEGKAMDAEELKRAQRKAALLKVGEVQVMQVESWPRRHEL